MTAYESTARYVYYQEHKYSPYTLLILYNLLDTVHIRIAHIFYSLSIANTIFFADL